ncbi:GNAT family N-acetyltransferase [Achromobacter sp. UMC46]|uniref:GNAT family N-acetyltransferase n=1 Tax=Achromobacter sp. UMC46 TaxID=1862319 RepID=UPI001601A234|nr:GNAT family N-acetyltransferase [Achromobacter sp. UMC46]MBB1592835.1 GCN5 family acetyltransferase [Achromobacter sp. UMC46]
MTTQAHGKLEIRRLSPAEWSGAYPVIAQLRSLGEAEFLERVRRQSHSGYELVAAFRDGTIIGVLGMRPVHTLARGAHLHVDDLVVDASVRGSGAGRALMDYAERDARARGMTAVFLDARPDAVPFYERENYLLHPAPSMKKVLAP